MASILRRVFRSRSRSGSGSRSRSRTAPHPNPGGPGAAPPVPPAAVSPPSVSEGSELSGNIDIAPRTLVERLLRRISRLDTRVGELEGSIRRLEINLEGLTNWPNYCPPPLPSSP